MSDVEPVRRLMARSLPPSAVTFSLEGKISNTERLHLDDAIWLARQFPQMEWRVEEWDGEKFVGVSDE